MTDDPIASRKLAVLIDADNASSHRERVGQFDDYAGWYVPGSVGQRLVALTPNFDPRDYACAKLITLTEKIDAFDIRQDGLTVYMRSRKAA